MKIAYIMRGVPGSGKSTIARSLVNGNGVIHSTDDYFVVNGEYRHDAARLREFHKANLDAFCQSLLRGIPVVVCDNTNSKRWEFAPYVEAAQKAGYAVAIVSLPHPPLEVAVARNFHRVPAEAIEIMIARWEY